MVLVVALFFGICFQASAQAAELGPVAVNTSWIGANNEASLTYTLLNASDANVILKVYDASGMPVRVIDAGTRSSGTYDITWDGRDDSGSLVPDGNYTLEVYVTDEGNTAYTEVGRWGTYVARGGTVDSRGYVYVFDRYNGPIKVIYPNNTVQAVQTGMSDLGRQRQMAADSRGNLYLINDSTIGMILPDGATRTFVSGFQGLVGITAGADGSVYVIDEQSTSIKRIYPDRTIQTVMTATGLLQDLAVDAQGNVYAMEEGRLLVIYPNGTTAQTGTGNYDLYNDFEGNVYAYDQLENAAYSLGLDGQMGEVYNGTDEYLRFMGMLQGDLYFYDSRGGPAYRVSPDGQKVKLGDFSSIGDVAMDGQGNIYATAGGGSIKAISPDGTIKTRYQDTSNSGIRSIAVDGQGNIYMLMRGVVKELYANDTIRTLWQIVGRSEYAAGLAVDAQGNVYTTNKWMIYSDAPDTVGAVYQICPDGRVLTRGSGFMGPESVNVDPQGNLYVWDEGIKVIRPDDTVEKLNISTPDLAIDGQGNIYVVNQHDDHGVKMIRPDNTETTLVQGIDLPMMVAASPQGDFCVVDSNALRAYARTSGGPAVSEPVHLGVDRTPPTISGHVNRTPGESGWYNTSVDVWFTASDEGSGLASLTPGGTISDEGASRSVVGSAADKAGNRANASVDDINIDMTPPIIRIDLPASNYTLNQPVTARWNWSDSLSGPAEGEITNGSGSIDTSRAGLHGFTVEATDSAGNHAVKTADYGVTYRFDPVITPRYTLINHYVRMVPIAFRLYDYNDKKISSATARLYLSKVGDGPGVEFPPLKEYSLSGDDQFRYMEHNGLYYYVLYTRGMDSGTWQLRVELDDGTSRLFRIYISGSPPGRTAK